MLLLLVYSLAAGSDGTLVSLAESATACASALVLRRHRLRVNLDKVKDKHNDEDTNSVYRACRKGKSFSNVFFSKDRISYLRKLFFPAEILP